MSEHIEQILYKSNIIQPLKGFCNTVKYGSIVKASEQIGLTQSTVTKQIQSLERDLNVKLFNRDGRKLIPTKDGLKLYELALPRIQAMENLFNQFLEERDEKELNTIRIAAHHVAISHILPDYIYKFQKNHTKTTFNIQNLEIEKATEMLHNQEIDFMLYPKGDVPVEFHFKEILSCDPYLIVNKNHPLTKKDDKEVTIDDFGKYNFIHLGSNITMPLFKDTVSEYNIGANIQLINGTWEIVKGFAKAKIGISGVASIYIEKDNPDLVFKNVSHIVPKINYGIMVNRRHHLKPKVKELIEIVKRDFFDY